MSRNSLVRAAAVSAACLTISGCLLQAVDPNPEPVEYVRVDPKGGAVERALAEDSHVRPQAAVGEDAAALERDIRLLLELYRESGETRVTAFLKNDGFSCWNLICAYYRMGRRKYQLGGAYNPDFLVSALIVALDDDEAPTPQGSRLTYLGDVFRKPHNG